MSASMNVLYQPFTQDEVTDSDNYNKLASQDNDLKSIGHNKGNYVIAFLIILLIFSIVVTVFNGIVYNKVYRETSPDNASDSKTITTLRGLIRDSGYYDGSIAMAAIGVVGLIISIVFFALWHKDYQLELMRENIMGRDIAQSMRVGASIDKASNLLSAYVHPLNSQKVERQRLASNFSQNLRSNMSVIQNVQGNRAQAYYTQEPRYV